MLSINNRRYIGNKFKLLERIYKIIIEKGYNEKKSFFDVFAGTGVVSHYFAEKGHKVIMNDFLYSNTVCHKAWLEEGEYDQTKIEKYINYYNNLNSEELQDNYFSVIYGNKYYTVNDAKKIGYIRENLEKNKNKLTEKEYNILLTSLIYAADKSANTVGHFEHYLNEKFLKDKFKMEFLELKNIIPAKIYNMDSNDLVKLIFSDIAYIDPPYNARQYINFYHVIENLARWEKPTEFEGKSMKFKRDYLKSGYSRSEAPLLMKDLIDNLKCKLIIVSYNNTYTAKSSASNNKISEEELIEILKNKGKVSVEEIKHKFFNAGKTNFNKHVEKLYICEVE